MTKANDLASLLDANGDVVSSALDNVPASDLVNDTTPQLGGNLDLNSNNITGTGTVDGRDVATDGTKLDGIEALADVTDDTNVRAAGAVMTTGISTLADSAYFRGAPTHGFRFNNNTDAYNNFIIRENGDTYTRGNAGIGTASPHSGSKLHILAAGTTQLRLDSSGAATGDGSFIRFMKGGTDIAYIGVAGTILGSTSNDTMFYADGANNMRFSTNGTERLRIKSNGQIYAAAESQSIAKFGARKSGAAIEFGHANNTAGYYGTLGSYGGGGQPYIGFSADAEDSVNTFTTRGFKGNLIVGNTNGSLTFQQLTNPSATGQTPVTRMTIDNSGNVAIGVVPSSGYKFTSSSSGTSGLWAGYFHGRDYAKASRLDTSGYVDFFYTPTGYAGYIYVDTATNTTTYASSSDYRLKTEVTYDWDATTRLKQLKPTRFKWISAGDDAVPVDGFLAHEVQNVVPEAVVGTKDAMRDEEYEVTPAVEATYDDDGNILTEAVPAVMGTRSVPDYQGIDQSKLTPLLTKALIEAVEKIEQLEARIIALETAE